MEKQGWALYEVLKGVDCERRQLVGKKKGIGLLELVEDRRGDHRCYACTLCERTCPVDCIELEYCPEFPEQPFDVEAARTAALATLPGESCGAASACVMGEKPADFQPPVDMKLLDPVIAGIHYRVPGWSRRCTPLRRPSVISPGGSREHRGRDAPALLAGLRDDSQLLQPVPAPAGGQVCHRRVHGHGLLHVAGAPLVVEAFSQELEIPIGGTTADGLFTLQTVNCVGACALAPRGTRRRR